MDKTERCPECGYTDADARIHMDHHTCTNYPFFTQPGGYEAEAAKALASTTSEADESFPPFGWRIVNTCLELTFMSSDVAVSALTQLQELRRTPAVADEDVTP